MRTVRNIGIAGGAMVLLLVLIAFFLPGNYEVKRETRINRPASVVFEEVSDFHNYLQWNPWSQEDMTSKHIITGALGMPGSKWTWEGKKTGKGSMTLLELSKPDWIINKLVFEYPHQMESLDLWFFREEEGVTHVEWINSGELGYPLGRWLGLFMDRFLGNKFEEGLDNLKHRCEQIDVN
jgi:hypothetical protein